MKCLIRASHEDIIMITNSSDHILYWHDTAVARCHTKVKSSVTRILNDFRLIDIGVQCVPI